MTKERYKIAVAGTGYVGMSLSVLLSQNHDVTAVDVIPEKVDKINRRISPIEDSLIEEFLATKKLSLRATMDAERAYREADFILVCVPTNYDSEKGEFDTHHVEEVVEAVMGAGLEDTTVVIKSTIPIGYTESLRNLCLSRHGVKPRIIFSPEFLREGSALWDNLHPSRIIVGFEGTDSSLSSSASEYSRIVADASLRPDVPVLRMGTAEAEAVKLFANTYLALRVSYFNELDTYAEIHGLDPRSVIGGVCTDPRIGLFYNNPSFGYGGYCFPKDTMQLLANFSGIQQATVTATVTANTIRKRFIAERIAQKAGPAPSTIGVYRLAMKSGSDNFRESAVFDIMAALHSSGYRIAIYEPSLREGTSYGPYTVIPDLSAFKTESSVIVANRFNPSELDDVADKVYTRDIFKNN